MRISTMLEQLLELQDEMERMKNATIRYMTEGDEVDAELLDEMCALTGIPIETHYVVSKIHAELVRMQDALKNEIRCERMRAYVRNN
jgi:hypothetical protein